MWDSAETDVLKAQEEQQARELYRMRFITLLGIVFAPVVLGFITGWVAQDLEAGWVMAGLTGMFELFTVWVLG